MDAHERRALPEGWEWCEILDVAAKTKYPIGDGDHGQIKPSMYTNSGIPYIRVADISKGEIKKEKLVYISKEIHEKNLKSELHPDDIIISKTGATIGKVAIIPDEIHLANTTSSVGKITLDHNKMIPKFLFYFMNTKFFQNQMWSVSFKSAQPGFNIIDLKKFKILVPPLPTQRRIVSILEKAGETMRLRAQADELTNRLLQSVFLEMFGDPVKNPKGWEIKNMGTEITDIRYGTGSPPEYQEEGIPFIRATNIKKGTVQKEGLVYISKEEANKIKKCEVKTGDLILVRSGVNTGDCARIPPEYDGAYAGYDLVIQMPYPKNYYYNFIINSDYGKSVIKPLSRRAGQPHINADQVKSLQFPVSSVQLLEKFARIVEKIEFMRQSQNQSKQQIEDLFSTLMQKAFKGELVA